ncbi:MAG: DUF4476 domain-containing protein [Bacteroidales bacterium]|nr:DUF4476 domain-containing protein [Bacteroidales bacterium]MDD4384868.1 DUF4476 domain-containing protein [Bacteroidales bacterium]MDY0198693.1 DUF4476 domain-containing protein [Tenuifilaceae bacterium]
MKNLITLLFLFVAFNSFSQTNDIVVFSERGDNFTLFVNSIKQNEQPRANVKAKDLNGESFVLRIEFESSAIPVMTKNLWTDSKGVELTSVIKQDKKGKYVLRYMGETPKNPETDKYTDGQYLVVYEAPQANNHKPEVIRENPDAETVTTTTIVTTGQVVAKNPNAGVSLNVNVNDNGMSVTSENKKPSTNLGLSVDGTNMVVSTNAGGENVNINLNLNAGGVDATLNANESVTTTTTTTSTTITSSSNFATNNVVEEVESNYTPVNSRCASAMSSTEFNEALRSIKSKSFEDGKLTVAKQICKANCMTAEQVRDMNKVFGFEDTKLNFAKFAYDYVYDASVYYKVNDSFDFESTIDELNEYIESK